MVRIEGLHTRSDHSVGDEDLLSLSIWRCSASVTTWSRSTRPVPGPCLSITSGYLSRMSFEVF